MNNANPLAGLVANYSDSEEESDGSEVKQVSAPPMPWAAPPPPRDATAHQRQPNASIHPAPIPHCPWSACYDEGSGFTYYWNQLTNAVTWEAPQEYLLALKLAQQQLHAGGTAEVSAKEWQLYQQALLEKQSKAPVKAAAPAPASKPINTTKGNHIAKKRKSSVDEEKIELITSYHNSDSESNDESESVSKVPAPKLPSPPPKVTKHPHKKQKTKPIEYGPPLPPNQEYTAPIGPELPPNMVVEQPKTPPENAVSKGENNVFPAEKPKKSSALVENEDSQDENVLFQRLKDQAKLLEKLGGELPSELQKIIEENHNSASTSPKSHESRIQHDLDIDDLLEEIEKKELPKVKSRNKNQISNASSAANSPLRPGDKTPPLEEIKALFPCSKAITEESILFPSAVNIELNKPEIPMEIETKEKKNELVILPDTTVKKKLRISNSVLPNRDKPTVFDAASYTTKYAQYMEGFSRERVGLGFKEDIEETAPKNTISYGNGLTFTKGEVLNEDKKDEDSDDLADLVEAKLKYLNQLQPCTVTPVQEMLIQLQTLSAAHSAGALSGAYRRRWGAACARALQAHEAAAAPPGWSCAFVRSERRYRYRREADGLEQWEYPALSHTDMDISTTPPHPADCKEQTPPRVTTPPPPAWCDPPPPGIEEPPPPPPPEPKKEIGDELLSFYNDIAELEKRSEPSPEPPPPPPPPVLTAPDRDRERDREKSRDRDRDREKSREKEKEKAAKRKSKVKISSSIGMKHKSVSSMVAKWQQVASEVDSE